VNAREHIAKIRADQASAPRLTTEQVGSSFAAFLNEMLTAHGEHPWTQIGRCVYCVPCGERLYQGTIPEGHPVGRFPSKPQRNLLNEFRERWGHPA
jgi:hypothetical protein